MKVKEIVEILGGDISKKNSKMPSTTFGLSTDFCRVGGVLRGVEGSVCEKCYAERLEKLRPSCKKGWTNRTQAVLYATETQEGMIAWIEAFTERLNTLCDTHHRWHDSGDLQSLEHLIMIVGVANRTPHIKHWLPTKEYKIVREFLKHGRFPDNLCVRASSPMVDRIFNTDVTGLNTSSVTRYNDHFAEDGHLCPSRQQGNACKDCRACWDKSIQNVVYPLH
jgi:hypothetical protein